MSITMPPVILCKNGSCDSQGILIMAFKYNMAVALSAKNNLFLSSYITVHTDFEGVLMKLTFYLVTKNIYL